MSQDRELIEMLCVLIVLITKDLKEKEKCVDLIHVMKDRCFRKLEHAQTVLPLPEHLMMVNLASQKLAYLFKN